MVAEGWKGAQHDLGEARKFQPLQLCGPARHASNCRCPEGMDLGLGLAEDAAVVIKFVIVQVAA
jgi:hypothetical protein